MPRVSIATRTKEACNILQNIHKKLTKATSNLNKGEFESCTSCIAISDELHTIYHQGNIHILFFTECMSRLHKYKNI